MPLSIGKRRGARSSRAGWTAQEFRDVAHNWRILIGDCANDALRPSELGKRTIIDTVRGVSTPTRTWHTLKVTFTRGRALAVEVDGPERLKREMDSRPPGRCGALVEGRFTGAVR